MEILDRREIEFDAEALVAAVASSRRAAESFGLPGLPPRDARFYPKEGEVDFLYGSAQAPRAVRVRAEVVGALLVSYCIRAKVPMPRKADKGVRIEANTVILAFRTRFSQAPNVAVEGDKMPAAAPVTSWAWVEPERVPR